MAQLPSYRTSKASMRNYEPVYKNLFEVVLTPPPGVSGAPMLMEHITKIGGLEVDKAPAAVEQAYQFIKRSFAASVVEKSNMDITLDFTLNLNDSNQMYIYNTLRQWADIIYDPLTGRRGLKKDYANASLVVTFFNKAGDIYRTLTFPNVFPVTPLPNFDFGYEDAELLGIEGYTLRADFNDDVRT